LSLSPEKLEELRLRLEAIGVREEDLEEKFIRASGPGGQKVNKTSVAVHLRHVPSGVEVKVQTSRSQSMNRFLARRRLVERLEAQTQAKKDEEAQRIAKIRRQKRKRSKRAKEKLLADKHHQAEKKAHRRKVNQE